MPVQQRSLTGQIPYQTEQQIKDLTEAVNTLEGRPGVDAALLARMQAEVARQAALIAQLQQQISAERAARIAQDSDGGGDGGGANLPEPLADLSQIVIDYANTHPAELANSCLAQGGSWDFMDGVVAALMAADPRVGWCGQRGDPNDAAEDAICYWGQTTMPPQAGQPGNYVVDIIARHCGTNPGPAWNSVAPAGAVWLPVRP